MSSSSGATSVALTLSSRRSFHAYMNREKSGLHEASSEASIRG